MLVLVLCIGAASAADIDVENDLNTDVSTLDSSDLNVETSDNNYVLNKNIVVNDSSSSQLLGVSDDDVMGDGEKSDIIVDIPETIYLPVGYHDEMEPAHKYNVNYGSANQGNINIQMSENFGNYGMADWWYDGSCIYVYVYNPINPGSYGLTISYPGDDNYNPLDLHVPILVLPFTTSVSTGSDSITVSVDGSGNSVTGNISIKLNGEEKSKLTLNGDVQTTTISGLAADNYEVIVSYTDGNFDDMEYKSTATIYNASQWGVPGFDNKNSGNSEYTRLNNAYVAWNASVNNPISSVVIDSKGNIYIADNSNVKIFYNNGTLKTTRDGGSRGAVSLIDDHILSYVRPWSNIVAFDVNTFSGMGTSDSRVQWYTNSKYPVIKGPDGRIYLSVAADNDAQPNQGKYVTMLNFDETSNQITYGNVVIDKQPISMPVFDDNNILYVNTVEGIRAVDIISSDKIILSLSDVGTIGRPVIDENNIVYVFGKDNTINALNNEGPLWNITVNNGIGSVMAIDNENGLLYSVDNSGILYSYNTEENGNEAEIYDIGANATTMIVDGNGILYIGDSKGMLWAFQNEKLVWSLELNSEIKGQLAMDKNGVIYAVTADTLYALGYKNETELTLEVEDEFTTLDEISITANMNSTFDGENITFIIVSDNGYENTTNKTVADGKAILNIANLKEGTYNVTAKYGGNTYYAEASENANFTVSKVTPELSVNINNGTVFTNATITVTSTNCKGNVTVKVGEETFDDVVIGEEFTLPVLPIGVYDVTVTYNEDEIYNEAVNDTEKLEITKADAIIIPDVVADADQSTITLDLPDDATGYVLADVNGTGYYAPVKDGEAVISIPNLEPGNYTAEITYLGDDNYNNASFEVPLNIPEEPVIEPKDPELKATADNTTITVSVNKDATGGVVVDIDGTSYYAEIKDGQAVIDVKGLEAGENYTATVIYTGDDNFTEDETTVEISIPAEPIVEPKDPELKATAENTTVTVNVNKDATGGVIVDVDGTSYYAEIKDGQAIIDVKGLEAGENYTATVIYTGDDNFTEDETTVKISVPKEEEIEPEDASMTVDSTNSTITVELPEDATGYVLVDVDGKGYYAKVTDGKATVDVAGLDAGNYTATVTYTGDDNYKANTSSVAVSIPEEDEPIPEPVTPEMTVKVTNTTIEVTLPKDATGNVLVDVNGQGYYAPVKDGKATVNVIGLDEGTYPATVTYAGDDKYTNATKPASVTVPEDEEPTPEPVDPKADINISDDAVNVELPKDATGYVLVDVDGKGYYAPVKDGKASIDLPELAPGNHTVTVTYTGDDKYKPATTNKTVTVEKEIITVVSENLTKIEKAPDRFEAVFTDSDGNALANKDVTFGLNDITYTRTTDANGKAGMNINLVPGTYSIKTTNPVTNESVTNTITVLPRFTEDSDLVKYFRNDSQYVLKVLDDNGNPAKAGEIVTYNINGVFYNRTTNATGHVKLSINLPPKTYIITAEYKGCKVAHNVTVLPTLTGNDLTKKYGQSGAYEAKLVDGQGKAYANQKIEFNINGVMYQRTTDANGVAKLNINLQAGKYIITASYGQARISNTVTVTA
ncbi:adhesin-like protein [Methanobrevibacter millerae]|uniref:Adhesin-like protein n=2 Tax=Methanobrevibacter millerae TaxID=230361 RepID=A0A0U3CDY3_9EURY|nr:adhesin-like protein [Methanobrevibacter millerae]